MILFEITEDENHDEYRQLEYSNLIRQQSFLDSIIQSSIRMDRRFLSQEIIKALNYHVVTCLHVNAGAYRPCEVCVGNFKPPKHYRVQALMDDFINIANENWQGADPFLLSAYVYWKINYIHPFINGNGRTARASCYFVLCVKSGGIIKGTDTLPKLLQEHRPECVELLKAADEMYKAGRPLPEILGPLAGLIHRLSTQQVSS